MFTISPNHDIFYVSFFTKNNIFRNLFKKTIHIFIHDRPEKMHLYKVIHPKGCEFKFKCKHCKLNCAIHKT